MSHLARSDGAAVRHLTFHANDRDSISRSVATVALKIWGNMRYAALSSITINNSHHSYTSNQMLYSGAIVSWHLVILGCVDYNRAVDLSTCVHKPCSGSLAVNLTL